jgi:hypothetical protein
MAIRTEVNKEAQIEFIFKTITLTTTLTTKHNTNFSIKPSSNQLHYLNLTSIENYTININININSNNYKHQQQQQHQQQHFHHQNKELHFALSRRMTVE